MPTNAGATGPWQHEGLALAVARDLAKYATPGCDRDDMAQAARIAVWRAAAGYDASRGVSFATYAWRSARREIVRAMHNTRHTVRVPVYRYARGDRPKPARSLNAPVYDDEGTTTFLDRLRDGAPLADEQLDATRTHARLQAAIAALPPRQAAVVRGRMAGRTLVEIGAALGLSRERTRQLECEAIAALRAALA